MWIRSNVGLLLFVADIYHTFQTGDVPENGHHLSAPARSMDIILQLLVLCKVKLWGRIAHCHLWTNGRGIKRRISNGSLKSIYTDGVNAANQSNLFIATCPGWNKIGNTFLLMSFISDLKVDSPITYMQCHFKKKESQVHFQSRSCSDLWLWQSSTLDIVRKYLLLP